MKKFFLSGIIAMLILSLLPIPSTVYAVSVLTADESVSNFSDLEDAINSAPNGTPYVINISDDILFTDMLRIPAGKDIVIVSASDAQRELFSIEKKRHFIVNGKLTLENIILKGNDTVIGGGIDVDTDGTLLIKDNAIITKCFSGVGGGVLVRKGATLIMYGGEISYNKTPDIGTNGGGVSMENDNALDDGARFIMYGGNIHHNSSIWGSGVSVGIGAAFTMEGGKISNNQSLTPNNPNGAGGGVHVYVMATFEMNDGSISNNVDYYGGGVAVMQSSHPSTEPVDWCKFIFNGGEITGNTAVFGGGIHAQYNGVVEMTGGTISKNKAFAGGGVLLSTADRNDSVSFTMTGGEIIDNEATYAGAYGGGGLAVISDNQEKINAIIDGSKAKTPPLIKGNTALRDGGGIFLYDNPISIIGAAILDNEAAKDGGGIYICDYANSIFTVEQTDISGNAGTNGGGIYAAKNGSAVIGAGVMITNNRAAAEGGGIYSAKYSAYLSTMDSLNDYSNIISAAATVFAQNSAQGLYNPPDNASHFTNLKFSHTSSSLVDHALNNYDINYVLSPAINYVNIIYHANDGTITPVTVEYQVLSKGSHNVLAVNHPNIGFTRSGYTFTGWNTQADGNGIGYAAGNNISAIISDVNLYAQWKQDSSGGGGGGDKYYKVIYDANGGSGSFTDSGLLAGSKYTVKSNTATGITNGKQAFNGWNTKADGTGTAYTAADTFVITADVKLFAQWKSPESENNKPELNTDDHVAYIIGYPDGNVCPENNITRAETATIFFRLLTSASRDEYWSTSNAYSDVDDANWFNNAVSTMTNAGIITGYTDGTFGNSRNITRAEFAAIAARFDSNVYISEDLFPDIHEHWAAEYINRAVEKGWINGYPDGTFKPEQAITRAEAMTLINRVLGRDKIKAMHKDMIVWPDNVEPSWYCQAVQEATNSHNYDVAENYETWTEVLLPPDWAALEKSWSKSNNI